MARGYVARELLRLGASVEYREGCVTDNGNIILDAYALSILEPIKLEERINAIEGVVANGLCARRRADVILLADKNSQVRVIQP